MPKGNVKWFDLKKGYGFIQPEFGGKDVFVHINAVRKAELPSLVEGQTVTFEIETQENNGKPRAVNITLLSGVVGATKTGTVKWFNPKKGYGFIQQDGGGKDVFVHVSAVEAAGRQSLGEGERLSFVVGIHNGKPGAVSLEFLSEFVG